MSHQGNAVTACERIGEHTRECVAACDGILTHERQHGPTRAVNVSELETKIDVLAAYSSVGEANASANAVVQRVNVKGRTNRMRTERVYRR